MSDTNRHTCYKVPSAVGIETGLVKQVSGGQETSEEAGTVPQTTVKGARQGGGRGLERRSKILAMSGMEYLRIQQPIPNTGGEKG